MKKKDDLFELISALSKSEKRYFKLFASFQKGEKNYLKLFEVMDGLREYDEKKLKKKLEGEKFVSLLSKEKERLHRFIRRSLRSYHEKSNAQLQIKNLLKDVEIFYRKDLFKQCRKLLEQAKRMASRHENYTALLEIMEWYRLIWFHDSLQFRQTYDIKQHINEQRTLLKNYMNLCDYYNLNISLYKLPIEKGYARTKQELEKYQSIISNPLFKDNKQTLSSKASALFMHTYSAYHRLTGNTEQSYPYALKRMQIIESNDSIKNEISLYPWALLDFIMILRESKRYTECLKIIQKLRSYLENSPDSMSHYRILCYAMEVSIYIDTGEFDKSVKFIGSFDKTIKSVLNKSPNVNEYNMYLSFCRAYFGTGDYGNALKWANIIINAGPKVRPDILCFVKIINLIIHFELDNIEQINYFVISTYRFLLRKEHLYQFETVILHFIRKRLLKGMSNKELTEAFKEVRNTLVELFKDPHESKALEFFDFIAWLDSKIENRSFAEIVKRKVKS